MFNIRLGASRKADIAWDGGQDAWFLQGPNCCYRVGIPLSGPDPPPFLPAIIDLCDSNLQVMDTFKIWHRILHYKGVIEVYFCWIWRHPFYSLKELFAYAFCYWHFQQDPGGEHCSCFRKGS